ncbi:MAG: hypothetical protein NC818_05055 [Candidatus Omnitrophica bacterium]|nr:hypothetical protein [Candidatus Omnitrophota bacterium]
MGKDWTQLNRCTKFHDQGKLFSYPLKFKEILLSTDILKVQRFIRDYFYEQFKKRLVRINDICSFKEKAINNFGRYLAEYYLLNYTEKIWELPASDISSYWFEQRIKSLSLPVVIKNLVFSPKEQCRSLVNYFYYPKKGIGSIYEKIKNVILAKGAIKLNSFPKEIFHNGNRIKKIIINENGLESVYYPKYVVSSIPISEFLSLLNPLPPKEIIQATNKLRFRSHISLFITIDRNSFSPCQWIYFYDKKIPFGRITEPKNFSEEMSPEGKTSLLLEFFCWADDEIYNMNKNECLELALPWLESLGFLKRGDIMDYYLHKEKFAYPVYTLDYKKYLEKIKAYLSIFENLITIGRAGCFGYNNQDHAIEMGKLAAQSIINNKSYHLMIDSIGAEAKYLENEE